MQTAFQSSATFTPAAATYGAGTLIDVAKQFTKIGPAQGGGVIITDSKLRIAAAAVPSGMTSFRLWFYGVTPPSAQADQATWDLTSTDYASELGYVDLGTPVDLGSTLYVQTTGINKKIIVPYGGSVFGELVANGGYTATAVAYLVSLDSILAANYPGT